MKIGLSRNYSDADIMVLFHCATQEQTYPNVIRSTDSNILTDPWSCLPICRMMSAKVDTDARCISSLLQSASGTLHAIGCETTTTSVRHPPSHEPALKQAISLGLSDSSDATHLCTTSTEYTSETRRGCAGLSRSSQGLAPARLTDALPVSNTRSTFGLSLSSAWLLLKPVRTIFIPGCGVLTRNVHERGMNEALSCRCLSRILYMHCTTITEMNTNIFRTQLPFRKALLVSVDINDAVSEWLRSTLHLLIVLCSRIYQVRIYEVPSTYN